MQWIYLICFILLSAGLLALFGVKPGDFIDAIFWARQPRDFLIRITN